MYESYAPSPHTRQEFLTMLRKLSLALVIAVIAFSSRHIAEALPAASTSDSLVKHTYDLHDLIKVEVERLKAERVRKSRKEE